jgi:hypothetical protein
MDFDERVYFHHLVACDFRKDKVTQLGAGILVTAISARTPARTAVTTWPRVARVARS